MLLDKVINRPLLCFKQRQKAVGFTRNNLFDVDFFLDNFINAFFHVGNFLNNLVAVDCVAVLNVLPAVNNIVRIFLMSKLFIFNYVTFFNAPFLQKFGVTY